MMNRHRIVFDAELSSPNCLPGRGVAPWRPGGRGSADAHENEKATETVLKQAELLCADWVA